MRNAQPIPVDESRRAARRRAPISIASIIIIVGVGALLATQIVNPTKRVIEALAAVFLVYVIWNLSAVRALWLLLAVYAFPFAISLGNSTFVFVVLLFVLYLLRVSARVETFRRDRRFDFPITLFLLSYLVSFYNISTEPNALRFGLVHTGNVLACVFLFYMMINLIDSEQKLVATMRAMMIAATAIIAFTIIEMLFPGRVIIPGWLYTQHKAALVMKGVRLGGPFKDFELVAEFFAMNVPIILFMIVRSKRLLTRSIFTLLLLMDIVMLFTTMTRGAFISLLVGLLYMGWIFRRDLNFVRAVSLAGAFAAVVLVVDFFVANYTISGSLLGRMAKTTFEVGIVPENRVLAWGGAIRRGLEHPIIGHGPGWDFTRSLETGLWPHNAYLFYFNTLGIFGLLAFIFFLWRLWKASSITLGGSMKKSSYPEALLMALNVALFIFTIDQIKIDYPRNEIYMYAVWIFFGLIAAASNVAARGKSLEANSSSHLPANAAQASLTSPGTRRSV